MGTILNTWQSVATQSSVTPILPDGCRDLICSQRHGERPVWFISALQSGTEYSRMECRDYMAGFRLPPGTVIDETNLLTAIDDIDPDPARTMEILQDHIQQSPDVTAILTHLADCRGTASQTARDLNIQPRQLHRILTKATSRGPAFWLQLARVRRAGRNIFDGSNHADIAANQGYADQSHMARDTRKWFAHTPSTLLSDASFSAQLASGGFC